jgi:hypothetical protein
MAPILKTLKSMVTRLWNTDAPLTSAALLLSGALLVALIGLAVDPRTIAGAPAWLKPAKFAVSTVAYSLTLAWMFTYLPEWTRVRRIAGWGTAVALVLEVVLIDLQAWRGTTSHFNVGTPADAVIFGVMGVMILVQTVLSAAVATALWRQPFTDRPLGWALRLGLSITIAGAMSGGLMARPSAAQLTATRTSGRPLVMGAHTIGAPDGGPGLPGTGWSRLHGDLRVPHFLGLHAMQSLPFIAFVLRRRRVPDETRVQLVIATAAGYAGLFGILLWQALRGVPLIHPDAPTVLALAVWAAFTAATWMAASRADLARPGLRV